MSSVKFLDKRVRVKHLQEDALEIVKSIRPEWSIDQITFIPFHEGITNTLIGCRLTTDEEKKDVILIRVYGEGSDLMIDRLLEMQNMMILNAVGCAKELYAKFNNGIAYGFIQGECLDEKSVRDPKVAKLIAEEMVRMMALDPEKISLPKEACAVEISKEPCLFIKAWKFFNLVPDTFPDAKTDERFKKIIRPKSELAAELKELEEKLQSLNSPVVFCHNDLLLKNIVYNEKNNSVSFIDYEYGGFNFLPYDIGNHFCEYAGVDNVDYNLYPDKEYQLGWLREFLECKARLEGKDTTVSSDDVEKLYVQTNKFALMAHFFWGLWGVIQARFSEIDFDYLDYAAVRFNEYFRRKEEFLAL